MSKALCSIGAGPLAELLAVARRTFEPYAERHGYDVVLRDELTAPDLPGAWSKVPLMRELLAAYDVVLWVDADAAFVDPSTDIADELEDRACLYLVEHRVGPHVVPNTGVIMARTGPTVDRALAAIWKARGREEHPWFEQAALARLLGYRLPPALSPGLSGALHRRLSRRLGREPVRGRPVRRTPRRSATKLLSNEWNSIRQDESAHPRIRHYPGEPLADRRAALERDVATFQARGRG